MKTLLFAALLSASASAMSLEVEDIAIQGTYVTPAEGAGWCELKGSFPSTYFPLVGDIYTKNTDKQSNTIYWKKDPTWNDQHRVATLYNGSYLIQFSQATSKIDAANCKNYRAVIKAAITR
ncbi:hypothetical protein K2X33_10110 [bacterium]|nr:hypothetical protein [bacterium]